MAVRTEVRGAVLVMTIDRPEARNAINAEVADGLLEAIGHLDTTDDLRAGVLTGAGRGFCAGMDLKAFLDGGPPESLGRIVRDGATKPLVAAIEGFALAGGLELALTCDLLVASTGAKLGLPEAGVGLLAAGYGLVRAAQRLPQSVALELALTADPLLAEDAYRLGLVNRLVEPGAALDAAVELAERVARNAPLSLRASKQLVRAAARRIEEDLAPLQTKLTAEVFGSADAIEGPTAFAQKRAPVWQGR